MKNSFLFARIADTKQLKDKSFKNCILTQKQYTLSAHIIPLKTAPIVLRVQYVFTSSGSYLYKSNQLYNSLPHPLCRYYSDFTDHLPPSPNQLQLYLGIELASSYLFSLWLSFRTFEYTLRLVYVRTTLTLKTSWPCSSCICSSPFILSNLPGNAYLLSTARAGAPVAARHCCCFFQPKTQTTCKPINCWQPC